MKWNSLSSIAIWMFLLSGITFVCCKQAQRADSDITELLYIAPILQMIDPSEDPLVNKALEYMNDGSYSESAVLFGKVRRTSVHFNNARYYLAHCNYHQGDFQQAIVLCDILTDIGDFEYAEDCEWLAILSIYQLALTPDIEFELRHRIDRILVNRIHSAYDKAIQLSEYIDAHQDKWK
jgi:hypothetical protein